MRDNHFYIATCATILAVSTWLCYLGKLDAAQYVGLIEWTFSALVIGGGVKKMSESYVQTKTNGNGAPK